MPGKRGLTLEERFWSKVNILDTDDCWLWTASKDARGYGMFSMPRGSTKMIRANRFVLMLREGFDIPVERVARHICNNTSCCNPSHILGGTNQDNSNDWKDTGQSIEVAFKQAKLTLSDIQFIKNMRLEGHLLKDIAYCFNLDESYVSTVCADKHGKIRFEG